ncbi:hypothetical protein DP49_1969 [Burkholderia pseudomallei]|uniref:hypothetical protein n=1 Tax=Burkholderia pseudomallei TaxID=28450 RepID=UPI00050FA068|nr:hypothetical protein [Burkholderia pseudomallei]KGD52050.1 hypothetical protein DP49_1969 [Burkholderia pseudomallei]
MKVQIKGFIFAGPDFMGQLVYSFADYDRSQFDKDVVKVREHIVEADVPDEFDPRPGLIANLQREKNRLRADCEAQVTELDGRIQSLLAIENGATS